MNEKGLINKIYLTKIKITFIFKHSRKYKMINKGVSIHFENTGFACDSCVEEFAGASAEIPVIGTPTEGDCRIHPNNTKFTRMTNTTTATARPKIASILEIPKSTQS